MTEKFWKKLVLVVVAIIVLAVVSGGLLSWHSWYKDPEIAVVDTQVFPGEIHIGEVIRIEISWELPWYRRPQDGVRFEAPDGLQILQSDEKKLQKVGMGKWIWKSVLELQAYDFGPFSDLAAEIIATPDK